MIFYDFSIESSSAKVVFSTEIFWDQMEHVVTEKHEFKNRHVSKLKILLGNFGLLSFITKYK